jgi:hypothetical protein
MQQYELADVRVVFDDEHAPRGAVWCSGIS